MYVGIALPDSTGSYLCHLVPAFLCCGGLRYLWRVRVWRVRVRRVLAIPLLSPQIDDQRQCVPGAHLQ